jgi:signal transduction histidine kinase
VSESRTTRRPPATGFPAPSGRSDLSRTFLVGASLVLAAAAALPVLAAGAERLSASRARDVQNVMETTSTLSAVAVFALCRARWRLVDERAALWAGAASLLVGVAVAARRSALGAGDPVLTAVGQAAMLVALGLFAAGLTASFETRQIPPLMVVGASFAALAVLTAVFRASPDLGDALTVSPITSSASGLTTLRDVVLAAIWVGLAVAYTVRGLRRRWLYTWGGLMLFALALAQLAGAGEGRDAWTVAGSALLAVGLLVAVGGCSVELAEAYDEQRLRLFDSELDAETAEVRQRLRDASLRRRRHDVINAITTIEGAALVLEREFDALTAADRAMLTKGLGSGTSRLLNLINADSGSGLVRMADAARGTSGDPDWSERVEVDVADDLVGVGSAVETTEAVRQLLEYACRRDPSSPVTITGERDGDWVVLRVEDRGPTIGRQERRALVDLDGRQSAIGWNDTRGVHVAARLMRAQGGDLWVEPRPGGGSSFGICLPVIRDGEERGSGSRP